MSTLYLKKTKRKFPKIVLRIIGLLLAFLGLSMTAYVFAPLILWQIFLSPVFASQAMAIPVPKPNFLTPALIQNVLSSQVQLLRGTDFNNAKNWFPTFIGKSTVSRIATYSISIPKLNIVNAMVTTQDNDLGKHLVNLSGTAIPPDKGNAAIFGHSTLPQLYNQKDYHTIFANIHHLQVGDEILVNVENITYTYKIFSITVVDPDNTSVLEQTADDSYLTIITCTPPGTIWERLVVKSRLQKL